MRSNMAKARSKQRSGEAAPHARSGVAPLDDARLVVVYWDPATEEVRCGFEGGAILHATLRQLGLPARPRVVLANVDDLRSGFVLIREDGSSDECAADL